MADATAWTEYDIPGLESWKELGEYFIHALDDGTREWLGELGRPSEDQLMWQPFPNGHSIGTIMLHIAGVEAYWIHRCIGGLPVSEEQRRLLLSEETDVDAVQWPTPPRRSFDEYLEILERIRGTTREVLSREFDPKQFHERPEDLVRHSNRWILSHTLTHESYHGGQAVLLALMQSSR